MDFVLNVNSIFDAFKATASLSDDRPFLSAPAASTRGYAAGAIEWTYCEASREIARLQRLYAARELAPGSRVAVAFDSRLEVYLHLLALNGLGISIVPLGLGGTDEDIAWLVGHSDCALVLAADEHGPRVGEIAKSAGRLAVPLSEFNTGPQVEDGGVSGDPEREAALLYTSGTTGHPKGCMLSNGYFLAMGRWYNGLGGRCALTSEDRLLTPLPPHHMNALCVSFMAALLCGGSLVQLDRFHPSSWWQTVREERATIIHYLGVMPAILLTLPPENDENIGAQVRFGFGAGSDPRHQARFEERFGFPLLEAWAMTETGAGAVAIADREPRHVGQRCIGRPSPNMEYRIVNESGADVRRGLAGEFLVRARGSNPRKGFFSGYYKDEQATREAWQGDWFHTGDVVREGSDGSLYFVDRRKNIIRRSGENVAAVEVEAALLAHPDVSNCAVTAVPDELRGEEVFAFVIPRRIGTSDAAALVEHCRKRLAYFKVPGFVAFVDELPLTASQKVNRAAVKERARGRVAEGDCIDMRTAKRPDRARIG